MRHKIFSLHDTFRQDILKDSGQRLQSLASRRTYKDGVGHLKTGRRALNLVVDLIDLIKNGYDLFFDNPQFVENLKSRLHLIDGLP